MKLAVGRAFPYPAAAEPARRLGLGTDGVSSNNNLDMLEEVKLFALLQKHATATPRSARRRGAGDRPRAALACSGGTPLEPGAPPTSSCCASDAEMTAGDLDADLVYAASGSIVDTTVVAGPGLMRGREVEGADEIGPRSGPAPTGLTAVSVPAMRTKARFPDVPEKAGHYESFYLKLNHPGGGRGAWIRHTVHKRPASRDLRALVRALRRRARRAHARPSASSAPTSSTPRPTPTSGSATPCSATGRRRARSPPTPCRRAGT